VETENKGSSMLVLTCCCRDSMTRMSSFSTAECNWIAIQLNDASSAQEFSRRRMERRKLLVASFLILAGDGIGPDVEGAKPSHNAGSPDRIQHAHTE